MSRSKNGSPRRTGSVNWPRALLVLILGALAACRPAAQPVETAEPSGTFAVRGASLVPMLRQEVLPNQTILVDEGVIAALGPVAEIEIPRDVPVIDGRGLFVMPGLWDLHVHLARDESLDLYLANGVTTIVNLGGFEREALDRRARIAAGELSGPRLLTCGPVVHGHQVDVTNVAARLAEISAAGYDCAKVYSDWEQETYLAAAEAAEALGLLFVGHVPRNLPFDVVLDDGREKIAHLEELVYTTALNDWLDQWREEGAELGPEDDPRIALETEVENLARRTVARGIWVVATEIVIDDYLERASEAGRRRLAARPYLRYVDPLTRRSWEDDDQSSRRVRFEQQVALQHFMLEVFREEGVKMALGTDAMLDSGLQVVPGWSLHEELAIMTTAGFTPYEALRLATVEAAAFMDREGEGVLRQGAPADLLVLGSDPLADVANAHDIEAVVAAGRWIGRSTLEQRLGAIESDFKALESEVAELDQAFSEGLESVAATLAAAENPSEQMVAYVEQRINRMGYAELGAERFDEAIRIFSANVEMFPSSANTHDSLAEAYLTSGDRQRAIDWYRKALEVDPDFANARRMLDEIGVEP